MKKMNKKLETIYKQIGNFCFDREDPIRAIRNMRNFSEGYDAFGIEDEELKVLRDRILEDYELSPREIADLGVHLFKTGKYEFGTIAIMLLKKHRPQMDAYVRERVKEWLDFGVENWVHADLLGSKILPVFFELELVDLQSFVSWRDSQSKWTRRAALSALMFQKQALDPEEIMNFIQPLISDRERVVQQAMGTLLRDLWSKAPKPVEAFLLENQDSLDTYVLKSATMDMPKAKAKSFFPRQPRNKGAQRHRKQ